MEGVYLLNFVVQKSNMELGVELELDNIEEMRRDNVSSIKTPHVCVGAKVILLLGNIGNSHPILYSGPLS